MHDDTNIGAGVVAHSILGQVSLGWETYGDESDLEDYFPVRTRDDVNIKNLCQGGASVVPYGSTYNINGERLNEWDPTIYCLLYTSPSPRDRTRSRMPSSA